MNSETGYLISDICDIIAYVMFGQITPSEILEWVYTIVLILSVVFGIVLKIISAAKDRKITKQEQEEIKAEIKKELDDLKPSEKDKGDN